MNFTEDRICNICFKFYSCKHYSKRKTCSTNCSRIFHDNYLKVYRARPDAIAAKKILCQSKEYKDRQRKRARDPKVKAAAKLKRQTLEYRAKRKVYTSTPAFKIRQQIYNKQYYQQRQKIKKMAEKLFKASFLLCGMPAKAL